MIISHLSEDAQFNKEAEECKQEPILVITCTVVHLQVQHWWQAMGVALQNGGEDCQRYICIMWHFIQVEESVMSPPMNYRPCDVSQQLPGPIGGLGFLDEVRE